MPMLIAVVSGGQTGVDQAALRLARRLGLAIGGWCPPARASEDGRIPDDLPLRETPQDRSPDAPDVPRSQRTEWNVRDSDATLILRPDGGGLADPGSDYTARCAARYGRPLLICDPAATDAAATIRRWLHGLPIRTLNVGGPSEATSPGIGAQVTRLLEAVFAGVEPSPPVNAPRSAGSVAGRSGAAEGEGLNSQPMAFWVALGIWVARHINASSIVTAALVTWVILLTVMLFAVKVLGLRIEGGQVYLGFQPAELGAHATIDATAGFQDTGIRVLQGQKLKILPEGRVHVAMDHVNNLTRAVKGILVQRAPAGHFPDLLKKRYPFPVLDESIVFYRDWAGPAGETTRSDFLEGCKLRMNLGWGALLMIVLPLEASARADPFEVLDTAHLMPQDLIPVPAETQFLATRDGWLTFIINEVVMSPRSPSADSRLYYDIVKQESQSLADPRHQIPLESIPLLWFADNNGAFRLQIRHVD